MAARDGGEAALAGELLAGAAEVGSTPERRREELIEQAERDNGWARDYAARVHDLAVEERLHPELAFLLVRTGFGVRELSDASADAETAVEGPPEWVEPNATPGIDPALEGRLRRSFRRMRSHAEESASIEAAVRSFLAEPDVAAGVY